MQPADSTAEGQAALVQGRWADARTAFEAALAERESPEALDGLGEALWWLGEPQAGLAYRERAFVGFSRVDDPLRAATSAIAVCVSYGVNFGNGAAAAGWLARAESSVDNPDAGPLCGWFWLMRGYFTPEFEPGCEWIRRALAHARETGDIDLELSALADLGGKLVTAGQVEEGLALIDEAMAGTLAGECQRLETVVWASCTMLGACEIAGDLLRAQQWLRVADQFTERYGCPFMYATCRTHYGGLLVAKGRWAQAERELAAAIRMSGAAGPVPHALALAQLAQLRFRQGRFEDAEALASDCGNDMVTARIRLARGEVAVAIALLERCVDNTTLPVEAAASLNVLVEAYLAAADLPAAQAVVDRLTALAAAQRGEYLTAQAALACGRLAVATGRLDQAVTDLQRGVDGFSRLDLPADAAQARLALARAHAAGKPELAIAEARAALTALDELGAATDADAAAALLRELGAPGRTAPRARGVLTRREQEVLHLITLGLSNPEIAKRLFISRKTAAHHVSRVLAKLGVRNRAEAVARARPAAQNR